MAAVDDNRGEYLAINRSFFQYFNRIRQYFGCLTISDCRYRTYE